MNTQNILEVSDAQYKQIVASLMSTKKTVRKIENQCENTKRTCGTEIQTNIAEKATRGTDPEELQNISKNQLITEKTVKNNENQNENVKIPCHTEVQKTEMMDGKGNSNQKNVAEKVMSGIETQNVSKDRLSTITEKPMVTNQCVSEQNSDDKVVRPIRDVHRMILKTSNPYPTIKKTTSDGGKFQTIIIGNSEPPLAPVNTQSSSKVIHLFPSKSGITPGTPVALSQANNPIVLTPAVKGIPTTQVMTTTCLKPLNTMVSLTPQGVVKKAIPTQVTEPATSVGSLPQSHQLDPSVKGLSGNSSQPVNNPGSVTMPLKDFINLVKPKLTNDTQVTTGFTLPGATGQSRFFLQKKGPGASYSLVSLPSQTINQKKNDAKLSLTSTDSPSGTSSDVSIPRDIISMNATQLKIAAAKEKATSHNKSVEEEIAAEHTSKVVNTELPESSCTPEVQERESKKEIVEAEVHIMKENAETGEPQEHQVTGPSTLGMMESYWREKKTETNKCKSLKEIGPIVYDTSIPLRGRPRSVSTSEPKVRKNLFQTFIAKSNGQEVALMDVNKNIIDMLKNIQEECKLNDTEFPTVDVSLPQQVQVNALAFDNEIQGKKEAPILLIENKSSMPCKADVFVGCGHIRDESINIKSGNKYFSAIPLIVEENDIVDKEANETTLYNTECRGDTFCFGKIKRKNEPKLGPNDVDYPPSESEEEEIQQPAKRRRLEDDRYACYLCHHVGNSIRAVLEHFVEKHMEEKVFVCQYCFHSFFTTSALEWHIRMKHADEVDFDEREFTVLMKTSNHYKAKLQLQLPTTQQTFCMREKKFFFPSDELFGCKLCNFKSWFRQRMEEHIRFSHSTVKAFKCRYCKREAANVMEIRKHQFRRHPLEEEAIEGNPARMYEATKEAESMYSVVARRGKSSFKVKKDWWNKYGYEEKWWNEHGIEDEDSAFVCKKCAYSTAYENDMVLHMRIIHNLTTTVTCCRCTRVIHTTPEEMIQEWVYCPECMEIICSGPTTYGLAKQRDSSASNEKEEETDAEPLIRLYSCKLCKYKSEEKSAVNRHLKYKHMDTKPYVCPYCDYGSVELGKLNIHIGGSHPGLPKNAVRNEDYLRLFEDFKEKNIVKLMESKRNRKDAYVYLENPQSDDGEFIDLLQDFQSNSNVGNMLLNAISMEEVTEPILEDETLHEKIAADLETVRERAGNAYRRPIKVEKHASDDERNYTALIQKRRKKRKSYIQQADSKTGVIQTLYEPISSERGEQSKVQVQRKNIGKMSTPLSTLLGRRTELHKSLLDQHHFKCKVCPYRCKDRSSMTRHVKYMHFKAYPHSCPYCKYCNVEKTKVKLHVKATHPDLPTVVQTNQSMITALTEKIKAYYTEKDGSCNVNKVQIFGGPRPKHRVQYLSRPTRRTQPIALRVVKNSDAVANKEEESIGNASNVSNYQKAFLEKKDNLSRVTSVTLKLDYMKKKLEEDKELLGTLKSSIGLTRTPSQSSSQTGSEDKTMDSTEDVLGNDDEFNLLSEDVSEQFTLEELSEDEDEVVQFLAPLTNNEIEIDEDLL